MAQFTQQQFDKFEPTVDRIARKHKGWFPANAVMASAVIEVFPEMSVPDAYAFWDAYVAQS